MAKFCKNCGKNYIIVINQGYVRFVIENNKI